MTGGANDFYHMGTHGQFFVPDLGVTWSEHVDSLEAYAERSAGRLAAARGARDAFAEESNDLRRALREVGELLRGPGGSRPCTRE